jgi:hypothetical protein
VGEGVIAEGVEVRHRRAERPAEVSRLIREFAGG